MEKRNRIGDVRVPIYEDGEFDKMQDPKENELARKAAKLKKVRLKQKKDNELKELDGTPTALDLEQQFYAEGNQNLKAE